MLLLPGLPIMLPSMLCCGLVKSVRKMKVVNEVMFIKGVRWIWARKGDVIRECGLVEWALKYGGRR